MLIPLPANRSFHFNMGKQYLHLTQAWIPVLVKELPLCGSADVSTVLQDGFLSATVHAEDSITWSVI